MFDLRRYRGIRRVWKIPPTQENQTSRPGARGSAREADDRRDADCLESHASRQWRALSPANHTPTRVEAPTATLYSCMLRVTSLKYAPPPLHSLPLCFAL